ncbi:hypothetical protein GOBAR_AA26854 [Gossypium barbadense]|uniref:Uncharacterized protein n=1 Tax=Gossypium barbadense TaxID=3634 RepID=A0A2P5WRY2_GOSBA|nr:hypothetical protein GOBAR_AA26854 [Gossypium barbadense]
MVQPISKKMSLKEAHESFSSTSRGLVHEDRRLQIEELDEWWMHKPRTPDKLKLRQNEPDTSLNQLKVGDKVLLDAADPHIVTTTPNEEIPLTVLSIFPFGTVEVSHPKFDTFKAFDVVFTRKENRRTCFKKEKGSVFFHGSNRENLSPSPLVPPRAPRRTVPNTSGPTFNCSSHDYREARENWHHQHPRRLLLMAHVARAHHRPYLFHCPRDSTPDKAASEGGHLHWPLCDLTMRHFGLLNTSAQESSLTLIDQMSPQGISSMLSMRMTERCRGTYPPQYRLAQSIEEEAYEDNPDDVPPQHEDPST